jgi:hypothetical protein
MFKNKHIIAALIITPILAIIAYFSVDYIVSEKPQKAEIGASYKLLEKPNCRYESGHCGLKNGNFEVDIDVELLDESYMNLTLVASFPLQGVKLALVDSPEEEGTPRDMVADNNEHTAWVIMLPQPGTATSRIRMVLSAEGSVYYGDTATTFMVYKTGFEKDFRKAN